MEERTFMLKKKAARNPPDLPRKSACDRKRPKSLKKRKVKVL